MGSHSAIKLKRNGQGHWIMSIHGTEVPPFLTFPFLCIGIYFLVGLGQNWIDRPNTELSVERTLSIAQPLAPGERSNAVRTQSKKWVWIEVEGQIYRCAGKGAFTGVPVVYQPDDPSKCREASIMNRPSFREIIWILLGSGFTFFGLAGLLLTPGWYRRRQNPYDWILDEEGE